jgi:hypothetical protein
MSISFIETINPHLKNKTGNTVKGKNLLRFIRDSVFVLVIQVILFAI